MAPEFGKPIHQLPLIPADVLKKHRVHEPLDTRFRSAAHLLQALWREDRALAIGSYVGDDGKRRKLGSRIAEAAGAISFMKSVARSWASLNASRRCLSAVRAAPWTALAMT
jgi:hypothetical protein